MDLIFNTETTGLVHFNKPPNDPMQPDMVQLACLLVDGEEIRSLISVIVIPEKKIEPGAEKVHGISLELAQACGVERKVAVRLFNQMSRLADTMVAHNSDFDMNVMATAYLRAGDPFHEVLTKSVICTMKGTTEACKLSGKIPGKYKWPTLEEAYRHFTGEDYKRKSHQALEDAMLCHKILCGMRSSGLV